MNGKGCAVLSGFNKERKRERPSLFLSLPEGVNLGGRNSRSCSIHALLHHPMSSSSSSSTQWDESRAEESLLRGEISKFFFLDEMSISFSLSRNTVRVSFYVRRNLSTWRREKDL